MTNNLKREMHNLQFFVGCVWKSSPKYVMAAAAGALLEAALPFVAILTPKFLIDEMTGERRLPILAGYIILAGFTALLLSVLSNALKRYMRAVTNDVLVGFEYEIGKLNMSVCYANLEDTAYIDQKEKAMLPIRERMTHFFMIRYIPEMVQCFLTILGTVFILIGFDWICLAVILVPTIVIALLNIRYQRQDMEVQKESTSMNRFFMYYYGLVEDFGPGKDIRLFHLRQLLMKRSNECDDHIFDFKERSSRLTGRFEGISRVLEAFRGGFVYGYIGIKALVTGVGIGSFAMYTGAAATFSGSAAKLLNMVIRLRQDCRYLEEFVKLEETPVEVAARGVKDIDVSRITLEFRDVSFHYPGTGHDVLKNVSFKMKTGDSLSIVGRNGAGKTTIIKLLSRLFIPTQGQILINGIDILTIDTDTYRKILSVVFQDFRIFEFSIEENITAGEVPVDEKLERALGSAGIRERVEALPQGKMTYVGKKFDERGAEFSGGEVQKLAIARALYKILRL